MIDISTNKRLCVSTHGDDVVPYIMLPLQQLNDVRALLDANNVPYWVDETAVSLDGRPAIIVINLRQHADPVKVQKILDAA